MTCAEIIFFFFVEKGELCLRLENNTRVYCSCHEFFARKAVIKSENTEPTLFNSEKEHVGKVACRMTA